MVEAVNAEEFTNQTWFHPLWRFADVKDVVNSSTLFEANNMLLDYLWMKKQMT